MLSGSRKHPDSTPKTVGARGTSQTPLTTLPDSQTAAGSFKHITPHPDMSHFGTIAAGNKLNETALSHSISICQHGTRPQNTSHIHQLHKHTSATGVPLHCIGAVQGHSAGCCLAPPFLCFLKQSTWLIQGRRDCVCTAHSTRHGSPR